MMQQLIRGGETKVTLNDETKTQRKIAQKKQSKQRDGKKKRNAT